MSSTHKYNRIENSKLSTSSDDPTGSISKSSNQNENENENEDVFDSTRKLSDSVSMSYQSRHSNSRPSTSITPSLLDMKYLSIETANKDSNGQTQSEGSLLPESKLDEIKEKELLCNNNNRSIEFNYEWGKITQVNPENVRVRSKTYLENRIKEPANKNVLLPLVHCQCIKTSNNRKLGNVAMSPVSWYYQNYFNFTENTFILILQIQIPSINVAFLSYFELPNGLTKEEIDSRTNNNINNNNNNDNNNNNNNDINDKRNKKRNSNINNNNNNNNKTNQKRGNSNKNKRLEFIFDNLIFASQDSIREERLKFIPNIIVGPFLVKKTVENKPVMIAKKLTHEWHTSINNNKNIPSSSMKNNKKNNNKNINYLEFDVQVDDSRAASAILRLVYSQAKKLVVDLSWLLQCETENELPESIMCGITIHHLDFDKVANVDQLYALCDNNDNNDKKDKEKQKRQNNDMDHNDNKNN